MSILVDAATQIVVLNMSKISWEDILNYGSLRRPARMLWKVLHVHLDLLVVSLMWYGESQLFQRKWHNYVTPKKKKNEEKWIVANR